MEFGQARAKVALLGASKQEISAAQALQLAKEERSRRQLAREQPRAAAAVQRAWRGARCRRATAARLRAEWVRRYGAVVAQPSATLPVDTMARHALPLALLAYLPPPGPRRQALLGGEQALQSLDDAAALRGMLALLLRSLASADAATNLLRAAATGAADGGTAALLGQLQRLLTLCCGVIGASDALAEAAAARVVALLCDPRAYASASALAGERLMCWLAPLPMLACASRRLLEALHRPQATPRRAKQADAALAQLLTAQLRVLSAAQSANTRRPTLSEWPQSPALPIFVVEVLAAPGFLAHCPGAIVAQLAEPLMLRRLCLCAAARAPGMAAAAALQALTALGGLLMAAPCSVVPATRSTEAEEFGAAAVALLQQGAAGCAAGCGAAAVEPVLQLFSDGALAGRLLAALPLGQFCGLYSSLLAACGGGGGALPASAPMRLLSALAFGTPLLAQLWSWLAMQVGLPLQIPAEATAWEVPSLPRGARSVPAPCGPAFGLFCQACCHYLSVADDFDFHEAQQTFSLPQARAIAASLTALVFRTQLPQATPAAGAGPRPDGGPADATLLRFAPRLLRALHERDARRRFCPPELWLWPYRRLAAAGGGGADVSGAAVLRVLLQERPDGEEEHAAVPAAAAAAAAAGGLAAVLVQAPQCIPFEERVAVFRGLVAMDKQA